MARVEITDKMLTVEGVAGETQPDDLDQIVDDFLGRIPDGAMVRTIIEVLS